MSKKESNPEPTTRVPYAHHARYSDSAQDVKDMGYLADKNTRSIFTDEEMGDFMSPKQVSITNRDPRTLNDAVCGFITKDSGERIEFDSGMKRDTQVGKPRYDLCDKRMYKRWAELMGRGADKYGENNWRKANSQAELNRFRASAERHLISWLDGEDDEDHAAAVMFNVAAYEAIKLKLRS